MLQHQLTRESQKCDHGFYFGSTCYKCEVVRLTARITALEALVSRSIAQIESMIDAYREEGEGLRAYFDRYGVEHSDDDCPQDDTCECDAHPALSAAWDRWGRETTAAWSYVHDARAAIGEVK